jgi:hypothetical protein
VTAEVTMSPSEPEKNAVRALNAGRLGLAEMWAWTALRERPESPTALTVLAAIGTHIGLPETALRFIRDAAAIDPQLPNLAGNLQAVESAALERRSDPRSADAATGERQRRYLVIKAWGSDFWSDACHVAVQALLAELAGRVPVVHWGYGSRFNDDPPGDCFARYFEPASDVGVQDLAKTAAPCFPEPWRAEKLLTGDAPDADRPPSQIPASHFIARAEDIAVTDHYTSMAALQGWIPQAHRLAVLSLYELWQRQLQTVLRPLPALREQARQFAGLHFGGRPHIAIDGCGAGLDAAASASSYFEWIEQRVAALSAEIASLPIFLMTDRQSVLQHFRQRYGDRLHVTDARRSDVDRMPKPDGGAPEGYRRGADALVGALVALDAVAFIGLGAAHSSCTVAYWRPWVPGRCVLFGRPVFEEIDRAAYADGFRMPAAARPPAAVLER